ncbi:MAG: hypothetical protein KME10_17895 [Plectolyngbya sp. WJT66-NPBG17]|nr:hypothetical protein [Plectolyngbya sp. WJT66-NPBG17]
MAKTNFSRGRRVPAAWFNAMQAIDFNGTDVDGSYPPLTDSALTAAPGNIKANWTAFQNVLRVTAANGLVVDYAGGSVVLPSGEVLTISPGQLSLAPNTESFVFVNSAGLVQSSTIRPVRSVMLGKVLTNNIQIVGAVEDLRPRYQVLPIAQSIRIFGGSGEQGSYTLSSGTATLSGENWFQNFTVSAGATLTIAGGATLFCSGNVTISGNVVVTAPIAGGSGHYGVFAPQSYPNYIGAGVGGGASVNSISTNTYSYFTSPVGSGGAGSFIANLAGGIAMRTPRGGNGGGCLIIEAAGTITVTGTITANGENGQGNASVLNFAGGALTGFPGGLITGAGGGSGGLIWLKSLRSVVASAGSQLSVKGGDGGTGYPDASTFQTAGGGGGGWLVTTAPTVNLTGAAINLNGGVSTIATAVNGSVSGGSFAGLGGGPGQAGSVGQLQVRNIIPI